MRIISLGGGAGPLCQLIIDVDAALCIAGFLISLKTKSLWLIINDLVLELYIIWILFNLELGVLCTVLRRHLNQKCLLTRRGRSFINGMKLPIEHARHILAL